MDVDVGSNDYSGVLFTGGVRTYLVPKFKLRATANNIRVDENDTYAELGAGYAFTHALSADDSFRIGGNVDELTL